MKVNLKNAGVSGKISLAAAALGLVTLAAFLIYSAMYSVYFDSAVVIFLLLGIAGHVGYALWNSRIADVLPLAAVICAGIGMNIFFLNSYTVWADWWGNFNMYGSQGGVTPVIIILILAILSIICGIVTCFTRKNKEAK